MTDDRAERGRRFVDLMTETLLDSGLLTEEGFHMAFAAHDIAKESLEVHVENCTIIVDGVVFTFDEWNKLAKVSAEQQGGTKRGY